MSETETAPAATAVDGGDVTGDEDKALPTETDGHPGDGGQTRDNAETSAELGADLSTGSDRGRDRRAATWWLAAGVVGAFLITHAVAIYQSLGPATIAANDVRLYAWWVQMGHDSGVWPGIQEDFVYPVGALVPMLLASVFGTVEVTYLATWCLMVAAINALTSWVVIRRFGLIQSAGPLTGWFVFLMLLGPCGLTRLDAVMMPLVMIALAVVSARPALASVLLTSAAWLKVSGGLILAPLFAVAKTWRARLLSVVVPAAATCLAVAIGQHSLGGQWRFWTSFVGAETDRGLQVEAVLATPVVLAHAFRGETIPQWNDELSTWETWGPGAEVAIQVSDIAMPLMVLAIAVLAWLARRRPAEALTVASLALMSGLIVTHKVGSPQFVAWIAPPLVIGLCQGYRLRFWTLLSATGVLAAALTGLLYPWGYGPFLSGDRLWLTIWVVRNLLVVAIFVAATVKLVRLRPHKSADSVGAEPPGEPPPSAVTDQIQGADIIRTPSAPGDRPIGRRDPWMISPTDTHTGCSGTTPIAASSPPSLNGLHSPGRRTRPPRR